MADLPFLSRKNKQGGGGTAMAPVIRESDSDDTSDQMLERIAEELMTALHKKDIKSIRESLQALTIIIKDKDNQ